MTEPPRPPGEGSFSSPPDPTSPPPPASYTTPGEAPGYAPPPAAPQSPYTSPPQDAYGAPPGGYQPGVPGIGGTPAGFTNNDDKTWALIAHFGGAAAAVISGATLGWVPPLVSLLAKGQQSPTVRAHAVAALNFHILWSIIGFVGYLLMCVVIGFVVVPAAWIISAVFGLIAGLKANEGTPYKYPMSINIIK